MSKQNKKLILGIGVNDAGYVTQKFEYVNGKQKLVWICPAYLKWRSMIARCYSKERHCYKPTYEKCTVADSWLRFSSFLNWYSSQDVSGIEDPVLDKDIIDFGNTIYSPGKCLIVSRDINAFVQTGRAKVNHKMGVYFDKRSELWSAATTDFRTGEKIILGYSKCENSAHILWIRKKLELIPSLCAGIRNKEIVKHLTNRYSSMLSEAEKEIKNG